MDSFRCRSLATDAGRLDLGHLAKTAVGIENQQSRAVHVMKSIGRFWLPDMLSVDVTEAGYDALDWRIGREHRMHFAGDPAATKGDEDRGTDDRQPTCPHSRTKMVCIASHARSSWRGRIGIEPRGHSRR